jgi:hypothetical protein
MPNPDSAAANSDTQSFGRITGSVMDAAGDLLAGARITLTHSAQPGNQQALSDDSGTFSFANVLPGAFQVVVSAQNFTSQTVSGTLQAGQSYIVAPVTLSLATVVSSVKVTAAGSQMEIAQQQMKLEETQRVLAVVPNFYVSYVPNAAPLSSKQKFQLAWKTTADPFVFGLVGAIAGIQQAANQYSGFGQGASGYAKRYGASYADTFAGTFLGSAIFPSLLKQDPRYFYKGTGTVRARLLYALANAVICKGDNKKWQPNYSNVLGNLAAGGLSNLYYPAQNRQGAELTFESAAIGIGATAAANVLEEFVIRKLTPNAPAFDPSGS